MTAATAFDVPAEAAVLTAALKAWVDPSYEAGMRRTVPSALPAHAVRVPEIRRVAQKWSREHRALPLDDLLALAEALWATGWREERILAIALLGRRRDALTALPWELIARWSASIDNWEHVDNMAGLLTAPMLTRRPELIERVRALAENEHVWQRRLAVVTLIVATRADGRWLAELESIEARLHSDRGPTMRKALDWARRTAAKVKAKG